ncbi:KxYKxGKxW signal peptide domain-containing protein, partial [Floricoccus penangensis]|uniref:KxYKxGKxW signal peptide domain-containing protein n=1 Tax=Floricoccus penangensis TaxID=1859475 RepID=UPI001571299D
MKQIEEKKRYKQFKKGKFWVTAPVTFLVIGGTLAPSIGGIAQTLESVANTKPNVAVSTSSTSSSAKVQAASSVVPTAVQATSEVKVETKVQEPSLTPTSEKAVSTVEESKLAESTSEVSTTEVPKSETPIEQVSTTEAKTSETTKEVSTSETPKSEVKKETKEVKSPSTTTQDKKEVAKEEVETARLISEKVNLQELKGLYPKDIFVDNDSVKIFGYEARVFKDDLVSINISPAKEDENKMGYINYLDGDRQYKAGDMITFEQKNSNGTWEYKEIQTEGNNNAKIFYTPDSKDPKFMKYKELVPGVEYRTSYTNIKSNSEPSENTYHIIFKGENLVSGNNYDIQASLSVLPGRKVLFHYKDASGNVQSAYIIVGEEPKVDPVPEPSTSAPTAPTSSSTSEPTVPTSSSTSEPTVPTSS